MAWWNKKVVFPVKRALVAVAARVKARKHGGDGISRLHDDVQICGYEDVQVMWEMLRRSEELPKQRKRRFFSRPSASSRPTTSCDSTERHHHHRPTECASTGPKLHYYY
ncbi:hypothetical protein OPV22_011877 [Ensete ventricosum]|uniref:Uncharacterized protein n=1 Tax=Ensete ventricosum TaxID=4639 RepID=A0AAV8PYL2_ENSVE|nr:hypothetical protein OPV22_011877 [Ensete ventricosum]